MSAGLGFFSARGVKGVAMRYLVLLLLAPLAGCAYTNYLTNADAHGGTVNLVSEFNHDAALQKANDHCHRYNMVARVTLDDQASNSMSFVCQPP